MKKSTIRGALALSLVFAMIVLGACSSEGGYEKWQVEDPFKGEDLSEYITLGEYKGIEITILPEEADEESVLKIARQELHTKIDKTVVEKGDVVIFDYEGTADGLSDETLQGMKAEKAALVIGDGGFIPGFEEQIEGQAIGKAFDVDVTFPEDYHAPELAGKDVTFRCTVHEIHKVDLTDAKVQEVMGEEFESLEALYENIRAYFLQPIQEQNVQQGGSEAIEAAFQNTKVTKVPARELEMYKEMINREVAASGQTEAEYLTMMGLDPENWVSQVEEQLGWEMFICAIAQKEDQMVTEEEFKDYLDRQRTATGDASLTDEALIEQSGGRNIMLRRLTQDKVIYFVYENAKKTEQAAEAAEDTHTADDGHAH